MTLFRELDKVRLATNLPESLENSKVGINAEQRTILQQGALGTILEVYDKAESNECCYLVEFETDDPFVGPVLPVLPESLLIKETIAVKP